MWMMPTLFGALIFFGLWGMRQTPGADLTPYMVRPTGAVGRRRAAGHRHGDGFTIRFRVS